MAKKVYGIDLGTTYSVIATLDENGNPIIIRNNDDDSDTLASAVLFEEGGGPVVGEVAKEEAAMQQTRVVQFIKREIGKADGLKRNFDGEQYDPIDISALILKRIKAYADSQGENVEDVVITCPAYFGMEERNATRQAGELAGLNVLNIINEPTAAALNYCCREFQESRKILVYDLGGGTFDVTLLDMIVDDSGAKIDIIRTGGDDRLGGVDWDNALYDHVETAFCDENGIDSSDVTTDTKANIRVGIEKMKKKLSNKLSDSMAIVSDGAPTKIAVSREQFEEITKDKVDRTMSFVNQVLSEANTAPEDIDIVLLVGGSTKMPVVKNTVEAMFPGKVKVEDPDLAVAKGAALYAGLTVKEIFKESGGGSAKPTDSSEQNAVVNPAEYEGVQAVAHGSSFVVSDKLSRTFGVGVFFGDDYLCDNILFLGEDSPSERVREYVTRTDNMENVQLRVFENVSEDRENMQVTPSVDRYGEEQYTDPLLKVKLIGTVVLALPPNTPAGSPLEVTLHFDAMGLSVTARNPATNDVISVNINSENTKTQEEIEVEKARLDKISTRPSV